MTSIPEALGRLWAADDDAPMLQTGDRWIQWGQIRALAEDIDRVLTDVGCDVGGRVAVVLGNSAESVAALIAVMRSERTLVTISPLQPVARLVSDLEASGACYVLAPADQWNSEVFTQCVDRSALSGWQLDIDGGVTERARGSAHPTSEARGVAIEMLTSGTTGAPKRIPLTSRQLTASLASALQHTDSARSHPRAPLRGKVALVTIPIVHIGGLWGLLQGLVQARRVVMLERFTVDGWRRAVSEHRPAVAGLPPAAIRSVLDGGVSPDELSSLRAINAGTSPVDPALVDAFHTKFGIPILIVYGATEFSGAVAGWTINDFDTSWAAKKGSVGRAFPGVELSVVDEAGAEVGPGTSGRLRVRSAQTGDGASDWVTTSDLACIDGDGFLYIEGRADDVIIRGGFKVSPDTVVKVLKTHDSVADAAVAGIADRRLGQVPVAAVEIRNGATVPSGADLKDFCRDHLTPYEVPVVVHVVDELPRGAALKVDRRRLIAMIEDIAQAASADPVAVHSN